MHTKLFEKIHQLISVGVTNVKEIKRALEHYVKYELCSNSTPDPNDQTYHPSNTDIKNIFIVQNQSFCYQNLIKNTLL